MKFQVSNTNDPQWRSITVKSELPGKLNKLNELSRNLWWAWNTEGKTLFHDLDRDTWRATSENPVKMLQRLSNEKIAEIQADSAMMARIDKDFQLGVKVGVQGTPNFYINGKRQDRFSPDLVEKLLKEAK